MKFTSRHLDNINDIFIIVITLTIGVLFSLVTSVRIGILSPEVLPQLEIETARAATWEARVGRLHGGGSFGNTWCDGGYWLAGNRLDVGNTNNAIWLSCITGAW